MVLLLLLGRTGRSDGHAADGRVHVAGGGLHLLLILRGRRRARRRRRRRGARRKIGRAGRRELVDGHDRCIGSADRTDATTNGDGIRSGHDWLLWLLLIGGRRTTRRCGISGLGVLLLLGDVDHGHGNGHGRRCGLLLLLLLLPVLGAGVCHDGKEGVGVWEWNGDDDAVGRIKICRASVLVCVAMCVEERVGALEGDKENKARQAMASQRCVRGLRVQCKRAGKIA